MAFGSKFRALAAELAASKMRSSPQQQRRGLDRQATLHTIYEEKDSKYGGYSGEYPTKFL
ncbi:hypothetical protein [Escherichia coli]